MTSGESYRREPALRPPTHELVPYLTHEHTSHRCSRHAHASPRAHAPARDKAQRLGYWPRLVGDPHSLVRSLAPQADLSVSFLRVSGRPGHAWQGRVPCGCRVWSTANARSVGPPWSFETIESATHILVKRTFRSCDRLAAFRWRLLEIARD